MHSDYVAERERHDLLSILQNCISGMSDVAGWGATCEGCSSTNMLRFTTVPLLNNAECNTIYPGRITSGMLCAGFAEGGRGACHFDTGGPLTFNNQLVGVVSWWSDDCAGPNKPGVYARVSHSRNWINWINGWL